MRQQQWGRRLAAVLVIGLGLILAYLGYRATTSPAASQGEVAMQADGGTSAKPPRPAAEAEPAKARVEAREQATPPPSGRGLAVIVFGDRRGRTQVQGANVTVVPAFEQAHRVDEATTDAQGVARFGDLPADLFLVVARHPDAGVGSTLADLQRRTVAVVPLALGPGGRLEGEVMDEGGAPVEYAHVVVKDLGLAGEGSTDALGRFVIDHVLRRDDIPVRFVGKDAPGFPGFAHAPNARALPLTVEAEGYVPWMGKVEPDAPVQVVLRRPRRLVGRVLREGAPLAGAEVRYEGILEMGVDRIVEEMAAAAHAGRPFGEVRTVRTGPNGRFVLDGLLARDAWLQAVSGNGVSPRERVRLSGAGDTEHEVELEVAVPTPVTVQVVRASDGTPLEGVRVAAAGRIDVDEGAVITDRNGLGRVQLWKGRHEVSVWADGFQRAAATVEVAGPAPRRVKLALEEAAALHLRVTTESGAPVPGAVVLVTQRDRDPLQMESGFTDRKGEAAVRGLVPGSHPTHLYVSPLESRHSLTEEIESLQVPRPSPYTITVPDVWAEAATP